MCMLSTHHLDVGRGDHSGCSECDLQFNLQLWHQMVKGVRWSRVQLKGAGKSCKKKGPIVARQRFGRVTCADVAYISAAEGNAINK